MKDMPFKRSLRTFVIGILWIVSAAISHAADKHFIVFFGYGSVDMRPEGLDVVTDVARAFQAKPTARIEVVGHTDTAEDANLGNDRARIIRDELVRQGVPANAINAEGRGSSEPMTPTAAGIREPTNRRATITIKDR